jgi:predicted ester cyclase
MSTETNKTCIQYNFEEGVNKQNLNAVDECFAPDYIGHLPGFPPLHGSEAQKQVRAAFFGAFPDLQTTVDLLVAEGDKVAVRNTWSGTHQGEFQGIPPTGKRVTFTTMDIYRMVDGKIAEHWAELDAMGMMQQLGVIPSPGQGEHITG